VSTAGRLPASYQDSRPFHLSSVSSRSRRSEGTEKPGEVITGSGGGAPEAEQVLMIIKTFLAEILLIKCCIYNIIRSPTVLISLRQQFN